MMLQLTSAGIESSDHLLSWQISPGSSHRTNEMLSLIPWRNEANDEALGYLPYIRLVPAISG